MDCSVTKRSRHMSNDGAPMSYQASYPEPRVSPQTATPPSSVTEEKRVIVPAGALTHLHELAVILDQFPKNWHTLSLSAISNINNWIRSVPSMLVDLTFLTTLCTTDVSLSMISELNMKHAILKVWSLKYKFNSQKLDGNKRENKQE